MPHRLVNRGAFSVNPAVNCTAEECFPYGAYPLLPPATPVVFVMPALASVVGLLLHEWLTGRTMKFTRATRTKKGVQ